MCTYPLTRFRGYTQDSFDPWWRCDEFENHHWLPQSMMAVLVSRFPCTWLSTFARLFSKSLMIPKVFRLCGVPWFRDGQWNIAVERLRECDRPRRFCVLLIALIFNLISWINSSFNAVIALSYETAALLPFSGRILFTRYTISAKAVNDASEIPAKTCWVEVDSQAVHKFCRNSMLTDVLAKFLKWRKNWAGVRSPNSSSSNDFRTCMLLESDNLFINAVFSASYWPCSCRLSIIFSISLTYFGSRCATTFLKYVDSHVIPAI